MARIKPKALLEKSKQKKGPSQIGLASVITYLLVGMLTVSAIYAGYKYFLQSAPPQINN